MSEGSEPLGSAPPVTVPVDEGLPQEEILIPEHVEEEAIRGDFVIRWAVVLLALLMGFALIDETATLVHVKSGQYLLQHGLLPPRGGDPFSATAEARTWFNLSWLFDVVVAGVYGVASWGGVSVLKGLLAAATFWQLSKVSRPGLPTWWGSICALPALIACQPRFVALPEVVTLLGVAMTLRLMHQWKSQGDQRALWMLVPVFFLWSQLDGRMFVGAWLLVLFAIGEGLSRVPEGSPRSLKLLLMVVLSSLGATMLHPFPGSWLWEPYALFKQVYPTQRLYSGVSGGGIQFYPVASPEFFQQLHASGICGLVLLVMAGVTLFLNRRRLAFSQLLCFFGFAVLMVLSVHEVGAAALVLATIATLNGQQWYEDRHGLTYTTAPRFLLLSRGGRAVTVVALFAIALFTTVGRITPPGGARLGFGLSPELAGHVASYESLLAKTHGDRGFNFNPSQGDLMIWCGKKPFIDQRFRLYGTRGEEDLVELHLKTRQTFRVSDEVDHAARDVGLETLRKYKVSFAIPRLTGTNPDYITMASLLTDAHWRFQRLGASTAVFYLFDSNDQELLKFLRETQQNFVEEAFQREVDAPASRVGWASGPSVYEKYLWGKNQEISPESLEGQHLMRLVTSIDSLNPGMAYLAIRRAQQALSRNPNDTLAQIVLGEAYTYLGRFDTMNIEPGRGNELEQIRYMQAVAAYQQSLISDPGRSDVRLALFNLYQRGRKLDLAHRELSLYLSEVTTAQKLTEEQEKRLEGTREQLQRLEQAINQIVEGCDKAVEKTPVEQQSVQRMAFYYQNGCLLKALEQIGKLDPRIQSDPQVMMLEGLSLLESGSVEEAYEISGRLEGIAQQVPNLEWRGLRSLCLLTNAEYERAVQLWEESSQEAARNGLMNLLANLSLRHSPNSQLNWPMTEIRAAQGYFFSSTDRVSSLKLNAALAQIEAGQTRRAGAILAEILEENPESAHRPTIAYYLTMIRKSPIDPLPPSERIPVLIAPEPGEKGSGEKVEPVPGK